MKIQKTGLFGSKEYHFLHWLSEKERELGRGEAISSSQERLALECGSSPTTVNKWLQALNRAGCVEQRKKGSYQITDTGRQVIAKMHELESLVVNREK